MITNILIIYFVGAIINFLLLLAWNRKDEVELQKDLMLTPEEYYDQMGGSAQILGIVLGAAFWFIVLPLFVVTSIFEFFERINNRPDSEAF